MSTTEVTPVVNDGNSDLTTEKVTYRSYVKFAADGTIDKIVAKAQTADGSNWKNLEKDGYTLFNENEVVRYTTKTVEAARLLIPDETQFMYIFQAGLNYLQNAKANALATSIEEGTDTKDVQAKPLYNGEELDLREAINTPPERKSLSPAEKVEKMFASFSPEVRDAILKEFVARNARQLAATEPAEQEQPA